MSAFRNFALVAAAAVSLAGAAQAQSAITPPANQQGTARGHRGQGGERGLFRDLNLTDAQKTQIKAIHAKYQPQLKTAREQAKPYMDAARTARQKGDTATARADMLKAREVNAVNAGSSNAGAGRSARGAHRRSTGEARRKDESVQGTRRESWRAWPAWSRRPTGEWAQAWTDDKRSVTRTDLSGKKSRLRIARPAFFITHRALSATREKTYFSNAHRAGCGSLRG
jgi:P pilus assembly/Cpx signaling pathway, periplasmic inhibitor/zinc-resistance associated protein